MIRAIRLELAKPLDERWETVGSCLRTLSKVTPHLLNAALDAKIAIEIAGREPVKAKVAPNAKAASSDGLAYQAVLRKIERLREWGAKKNHPFASLEVPGGMASAIARVAAQAYARRDQEPSRFAAEIVFVRASETKVSADVNGHTLTVKLRSAGTVRFAIRHSWGTHRETLDDISSGKIPHGDCKIKWDERRKKWYALVAYELPEPVKLPIDPSCAIAVHRGARNAVYLLATTGVRGLPFPGGKFVSQRRGLQARMRSAKHVTAFERGSGAKGHGRDRRFESYDVLEGKLSRVTHTFCQQVAAFVAETSKRLGCGLVIIEDYGGIEPDENVEVRRVLDRFPLYELKQSIAHRVEKDGLTLQETPSAYISSKCPRCSVEDTKAHNTRTGTFHCRACTFERPADWVAAFWMLKFGGADMSVWDARLKREKDLAEKLHSKQDKGDKDEKVVEDDIRDTRRKVQRTSRKKRAVRS